MEALKIKLFRRAVVAHGMEITPCSNLEFKDCFTNYDNELRFWFNTKDGSTHVLSEAIK